MNKVFIILILALVGCSSDKDACKNDLKNCKLVDESNLRSFHDNCEKLAKCMKAEFEVVHFNGQPHNPYACSIHKQGKTRRKGQYLYPKADLIFGEASSSGLQNELTVCEIMTETGSHSDQYYKELDDIFKKMDDDRKKRNQPKPTLPPMKIREG